MYDWVFPSALDVLVYSDTPDTPFFVFNTHWSCSCTIPLHEIGITVMFTTIVHHGTNSKQNEKSHDGTGICHGLYSSLKYHCNCSSQPLLGVDSTTTYTHRHPFFAVYTHWSCSPFLSPCIKYYHCFLTTF